MMTTLTTLRALQSRGVNRAAHLRMVDAWSKVQGEKIVIIRVNVVDKILVGLIDV
jgi:hypothetical protein